MFRENLLCQMTVDERMKTLNIMRREIMHDLFRIIKNSGFDPTDSQSVGDFFEILANYDPDVFEIFEMAFHNLSGQPELLVQSNSKEVRISALRKVTLNLYSDNNIYSQNFVSQINVGDIIDIKNTNNLNAIRKEIMHNLFKIMRDGGIDTADSQSVSVFFEGLTNSDPNLFEIFETAFDSLTISTADGTFATPEATAIEQIPMSPQGVRNEGIKSLLRTPRQQIYDSYIESDIWKIKKNIVAHNYDHHNWPKECVKCSSKKNLHLHHNYYLNNLVATHPGQENISDVDYLCTKCHSGWHTIQRTHRISQNRLFNEYINFITQQEYPNNNRYLNLLSKKIKVDEFEISNYFSREDVIEDMKRYEKLNRIIMWCFFISFVLIFVYGIGIITMIIALIVFSKIKKPKDYDLHAERKIPIDIKRALITKFS